MTERDKKQWDEAVSLAGSNSCLHWPAILAADAELKRLEALVEELELRNTQLADMHTAACGEHAATLKKVKRLEAEVAACITRNGEVSGRNSIQRDQIMDLEAEVTELRRDKDRLDWLDAHVPGRNQEVQARVCGYEEEYLGKDYTHREAIDEAMGGK